MPTWPLLPHRLAVGIGVCVALFFLTSSCASDAVPSTGGPHFTGERAGALEPGTVSTDAVAAMAQRTAPLPETGFAAARPAAEETTVEPAPGLDSSPPPSTSAPPIEPAVPEAPAEDPAATSTLASQDVEGPLSSADSDSSVLLIEEPQPENHNPSNHNPKNHNPKQPQPEEPQPEQPQPEQPQPEQPQPELEAMNNSRAMQLHNPKRRRAPYDRVWIVDDAEYAAASAAAADQAGVGVVAATGDLRALPRSAREAISAASEVEVLSDLGEDAAWQLEVIRRGEELPGGGLLLFEPGDESPGRRLVAAYGHPSTAGLGVLGEQGPEDAVERLRSIAEGYGEDGFSGAAHL